MPLSSPLSIHIDLPRIRANASEIRRRVGVPVYAVLKADGYGLGIARISEAIADVVDGFCLFSLGEAIDARLYERTGQPTILIGPPQSLDPADYLAHRVRPAVSTVEQAAALRSADPVLCVDTGMQRFACPPDRIDAVLAAGAIREAFTHAVRIEQARQLVELLGGRGLILHAAASSLLDEPEARLDAVRPGLALYRGAVRISTPLIEIHESAGPIGYTGFSAPRHGVILAGYAAGLRPGICLINGRRQFIPEVGMQSAYVHLDSADRVGDEVILLNEMISPEFLAPLWNCTPHEVLLRLCGS